MFVHTLSLHTFGVFLKRLGIVWWAGARRPTGVCRLHLNYFRIVYAARGAGQSGKDFLILEWKVANALPDDPRGGLVPSKSCSAVMFVGIFVVAAVVVVSSVGCPQFYLQIIHFLHQQLLTAVFTKLILIGLFPGQKSQMEMKSAGLIQLLRLEKYTLENDGECL